MLVGIYDLKGPNGEDLSVQRAYEQILTHNGIASMRVNIEQQDFWDRLNSISLFIMRFQHLSSDLQIARDLLPVIERAHEIKCYPNLVTGWHYDDKIKQYFLLRSMEFPMTKCWIFYDKAKAMDWVRRASYPIVFKLRGGAGSQNVILVKDWRQAQKLVKKMFNKGVMPEKMLHLDSVRFKHFNLYRELHHLGGNTYRWLKGLDISPFWQVQKNYVLFQKFLPDNEWDTRITVIGNRAFAFRRIVRENDFRASGSGRIDYDTEKIDIRCVEIAFEISKKMKFQSMAYDFLYNKEEQPEFCEISYAYLSRPVYDCPGYWDDSLNWHQGHFWPEYLHLVDSLGLQNLKMPEMDY